MSKYLQKMVEVDTAFMKQGFHLAHCSFGCLTLDYSFSHTDSLLLGSTLWGVDVHGRMKRTARGLLAPSLLMIFGQ